MATTPLSQAVLAGMDPNIYGSLQRMQTGQQMSEQGMDSSPTTKLGAVARLAQALSGSYVSNTATSELAKTIAGGKKSAWDDLLAASGGKLPPIPTAPPAIMPPAVSSQPPMQPTSAPAAPVAPEPGSPNAQVAARFPAEMSPGSAAVPLPADAPSPLDTAQYPAGPIGAPDAAMATAAASQPRGIRNNNPLNIEAGDFTKGQPGFTGSDGRFAKFETPEHGLAAAHKLLDIYDQKHGLNTVAGIVGRWAPQSDGNNTMAYATDVAGKLGIDPNAPVPPAMRPQLIAAMAQHENGVPVPGADQLPYKVAGPAVVAPQATMADDAELPAAAAATQGQAPQAGGIDVHRLLAVLQNPYSDDATKALAGKLLAAHLAPTEDTYGVTGEDPFGGKKYGFINTKEHTINGQAAGSKTAQSAGPMDNIDSSKTGDDYLKQFPPEIQTGVKDYLEGRRMPTGNPRRTDIVKQVASKYGNDIGMPADDASFGARRTMLNDLAKSTTGSMGGQITSLRTASNHLSNMAKHAEELGNWDTGIAPLNTAVNSVRGLGTEQAAKMQALQDDALHYGQEITKFYAGSPGGEAERQHFMTAVSAAKSPKELAAVIEAERNLIPGRGEELQNRISTTLGPRLAEKHQAHSPESLDALKRIDETIARMRGLKPSAEAPKAAATAAPASDAPKAVSSKAQYDALPSGSSYTAPDGSIRTKK